MNQGITNHLRDRKGVPSSGKAIMARTSSVIWSLVRAVLLIGLAYVILYPVLYSLSVSIREPSDMMDPTVIWLPKNLTLDNIRFVLKSTDFVEALVRSLMLSCPVPGPREKPAVFCRASDRRCAAADHLYAAVYTICSDYGGNGNPHAQHHPSHHHFISVCTRAESRSVYLPIPPIL